MAGTVVLDGCGSLILEESDRPGELSKAVCAIKKSRGLEDVSCDHAHYRGIFCKK